MKAGVIRHEDHDDASQGVDATGSIVTMPVVVSPAMKSELQCR